VILDGNRVMSVDHIRYDLLTQEALRSVLRRVLQDAALSGLPGDHHFYISFNTGAPGVRLSKRLRAQYPEEMTVVLQHQFRNLTVNEQAFEVGLSFSGVSEHLVVPFDAIKRFFDPSVQFGLQFETVGATEEAAGKDAPPAAGSTEKTPAKPVPVIKQAAPAQAAAEAAAKPERESEGEGPPKGDGGAEVVRLDRFRKK
jgi:uncharacterized protein